MYHFRLTNDVKAFDDFILHNNGSIIQTSSGAKNKADWTSHYIIGEDKNNKIVLTCLLLVKTFFKIFKMAYIPLGFVVDYNNKALIEEAIAYIKKFTRQRHIGFCFIDPNIAIEKEGKTNQQGEELIGLLNRFGLRRTMEKRPFIQPDTTYIIDLIDDNGKAKTIDDIVKDFEKGVRYSVRTSPEKSLKYETYTYSEIKDKEEVFNEFIELMGQTMTRLGSFTRSKNYFLNLLKSFEPYGVLNMVYYDIKEDTRKNEENVKKLQELKKDNKDRKKEIRELESKIEGYQKRISELEKYNINKIDKLYVAGSITVIFGKNAICLYGGSKNILRNTTRSSHYLNYKRIEDSVKHGCYYHDLSRIYLISKSDKDPNYGLYQFKRSFNAKEVKYIGEYAFINSKLLYFTFTKVLPLFRKMVAYFKRKEIKQHEV